MSKIFHTDIGKGIPLVFIHGFCEDGSIWNDLIIELAKNYRCICIDIPGFGNSEVLKNDPSIKSYAIAIHNKVLALQIKKYILIGHSLGGYITLEIVRNFSKNIYSYCLFHSHPFEDDEIKKENRLKAIRFIKEVSSQKFIQELLKSLFTEKFYSKNFIKVTEFIKNFENTYPEGIIYALEAMRLRHDSIETMKSFQSLILLIVGKQDSTIPYTQSIKMASISSQTNFEVLPNSNHMGMIEEPEKSLLAIKNWLKSFE
jgi:pimeloyl-ACP methyl ester carboxylesterase